MKEKVSEQVTRMNNEHKKQVDELKNRIAELTTSGIEMGNEIASLKSRIGGYKTSNEIYRRKINALGEELEKAKAYGVEADEMLNERILLVDEKKKEILELKNKVSWLEQRVADAERAEKAAKDTLDEYTRSSWLKRMFMKI